MIAIERINFSFLNKDNISINAYKWVPRGEVRGAVQISHGMNEHILRYDHFARELVKRGYIIYGHDHRGHGKSSPSIEELGYISHNDGFKDMVEDMKLMTDIIERENPYTDIILFGHSMGSFLSLRYMQIFGEGIQGLILSGTNGKPVAIIDLGIYLSKIAMKFSGRKAKIQLFHDLTFAGYNSRFKPVKTEYDWLSRDDRVVRAYIEDPYCGNLFPVSFFHDLYVGLKTTYNRDNLKRLPKDIPVYILAGSDDPVGNYGKGVINLYEILKGLNIKDVSYKLYQSGRHEMLNELNREEVIQDIIYWIDNKIEDN